MSPARPPEGASSLSEGQGRRPKGAPVSARRRAVLGAAAGVAMAAGAGVAWWRGSADVAAEAVPADFWSLRFERPEGGEWVMADFRHQALLINFWATWCAPCVRELPEIDRLARDHAQRGLRAIALAIDGKTPVLEFLQRVKLTIPIGLCGMEGAEIARQLGNARGGLPYTVLLAADGRLVQRKLGETSYRELEGWISGMSFK